MSEEERFDPRRHNLNYAAERLKKLSEKQYLPRLAEALGEPAEESANELQAGGVIQNSGFVILGEPGPEIVYMPTGAEVKPIAPAQKPDFKVVMHEHMLSEQSRAFIREEVARQLLQPAGIVDGRQYIRLAGKCSDGRAYRGMLYLDEDVEL